jgi:hypothetical protein
MGRVVMCNRSDTVAAGDGQRRLCWDFGVHSGAPRSQLSLRAARPAGAAAAAAAMMIAARRRRRAVRAAAAAPAPAALGQ